MDHYRDIRNQMVDLLVQRGVGDERVLAAMRAVPRDPFVPAMLRHLAYSDQPLFIGLGQTISQPLMVAETLAALELDGSERVLEIGTGSGYQTALLARLARQVVSLEILPELAARASIALARLGVDNVWVDVGDGGLGWPARAPYDAIVVAAACPSLPPALLAQLAEGGRLVAPVGEREQQELVRVRRVRGTTQSEGLGGCAFVPLTGSEGYQARTG